MIRFVLDRKSVITRLACALVLLASGCAKPRLNTRISLPNCFSDNMVLQRALPNKSPTVIWGWGDDGEKVKVEFRGKTFPTVGSARPRNGVWEIHMDNLSPGGPATLTVKGNNNRFLLSNVVVGDVWIVGTHVTKDTVAPDSLSSDESRDFNMNFVRYFAAPEIDRARYAPESFGWNVFNPKPLASAYVSSVPYYFGWQLSKRFRGRYFGVIETPAPNVWRLSPMRPDLIKQSSDLTQVHEVGYLAWRRAYIGYGNAHQAWESVRAEFEAQNPRSYPVPEPDPPVLPSNFFAGDVSSRMGASIIGGRGVLWCPPVR